MTDKIVCVPVSGTIKSGALVMDSGLALEYRLKYPSLPIDLAKLVKVMGNLCFLRKEEGVLSFPTRDSYLEKDPNEFITRVSLYRLKDFANCCKLCNFVLYTDEFSVLLDRLKAELSSFPENVEVVPKIT